MPMADVDNASTKCKRAGDKIRNIRTGYYA